MLWIKQIVLVRSFENDVLPFCCYCCSLVWVSLSKEGDGGTCIVMLFCWVKVPLFFFPCGVNTTVHGKIEKRTII